MKISPVKYIFGQTRVPGDKSISHRSALIAAIAEGTTTISGFASSKDCWSTIGCLRSLGVEITESDGPVKLVKITGKGLHGLRSASEDLDAGNSGSTMRMMSGILAGQPFLTRITGDDSLRKRPMKRIITPLTQMGAKIQALNDNFAPLEIQGGNLVPIDYTLPVASAQVKSAILLAGLYAEGETHVTEPAITRDHTERMLVEFGAQVTKTDNKITILGQPTLTARDYQIPGDLSSAAFLAAATLMLPDSELLLENVGINYTRRAFLDLLKELGAKINYSNMMGGDGEPIADISIVASELTSDPKAIVQGEIIANLIDEIPILAVLATQIEGGLTIRDAGELRVKESDRIRTVVDNLRAMGAEVEEFPDGLRVPGKQQLQGARIISAADHRIAMAFSVAGLVAKGETEIDDASAVDISFPGFYQTLEQICHK